ncbi:MAG: hypothetical protein EOM20_08890, partial [Spartobacteria bacterium]|nr:hypothetical protein [Spartobacteria bacterium]
MVSHHGGWRSRRESNDLTRLFEYHRVQLVCNFVVSLFNFECRRYTLKRLLLFMLVGCSFSFSVFGAMSRDGYIGDEVTITNWVAIAGLPQGRGYFSAVSAHGRIYCLGGQTGSGATSWQTNALVYDLETAAWTNLSFDIFCDEECRGVEYNDTVYIAGGATNATYALTSNSFSALVSPSWSYPFRRGAMAARSDGVYHFGGYCVTNTYWIYVTSNMYHYVNGLGWEEAPGLPGYAWAIDAVTLHDQIYLFSGNQSPGMQDRVMQYDGSQWNYLTNIPFGGGRYQSAECEGSMYIVGFYQNSIIQQFDGTNWTAVSSPSGTAQGMEIVSACGRLYLLGGFSETNQALPVTNAYVSQARYDGGVTPTAASMYYSREVTINGNYLGNGDITNVSICGYTAEIVADYSPTQVVVRTPTNVLPCTGDVVVSSASLGDTRKSNALTLAPYILNVRSASTGAAISNNESPSRLKETFADVLTGKVGSIYYTLHNDSQVPIEILSLTTNGVHGDVFGVTHRPATVQPNSSASLIVTVHAKEVGVYTASLVIAHSGQSNSLVLNMGASIADWGVSIDPVSGDDWFYVSNTLAGTSFEPAGVVASALGRSVPWPIVDQGTGWVQLRMKPMDVAFGTLSLNYSSGTVLRYINGVNYPAVNSTGIMAHDIVPTNWVHCTRPWVKCRDGVAVAANDNGIYLYGGVDTWALNAMPVMCYNGTNWSALEAAFRVTNLVDGAGAASGGDIYFSGGRNYSSGGYRTNMMRKGLHSFQPSLSVPQPVSMHAMAEYNNQVYILGGYNGSGLNSVYCYSPQGNTWVSRPSLPSSIYGITATELGDYLYVFGGYTIPDGGVRRTYRYNGSSWTNLSAHPFAADKSCRMSSARIRHHIYLAGYHTNMLVRFDGSNWTSCINMPGSESGGFTTYKLAAFRHDLYLVGADTITTNFYRSQCRVEGGVLPAAVACDTQTLVEISGENLGGYTITGVTLCGVSAEIVSVGDDNRIVVRAASCPNERIGDVKVFSWSEGVTVLEDGFEYRRPTPRVYVQHGPEITNGTPAARAHSTWLDLWQLEGDTVQLVVSNGESEVMTMSCSVESTPHATVNVLSAPPSISPNGSGVISLEVLPLMAGSSTTMLSIVHSLNPYPIEIPLRVSVHGIAPWQGPLAGGNVIALTNSLISFDSSVTSVFLGGISAPIQDQGTNWVSFEVPAHDAGYVDLSVYTASDGDFSL